MGRDNATFPARCPPAAGLNIAGLLLGQGSLAAVPWATLAGSTEHLPCAGLSGKRRGCGGRELAPSRAACCGKQSAGCGKAGMRPPRHRGERGRCGSHGDGGGQGGR